MITNLCLREPVCPVLICAILGLLSQTPAAASVRSSRAAGDGCIMDFGLYNTREPNSLKSSANQPALRRIKRWLGFSSVLFTVVTHSS